MKAMIKGLFIVSALVCLIAPVCAEESSRTKNWEYNIAPLYLWAVHIDGVAKIGPIQNEIETDFSDIFSGLEAAYMGNFEAFYKRKWGVKLDIQYSHYRFV